MLKNYLVTAARQLRKHPGYSALNGIGLALGLAACLLLLLFVRHETSYDRFHHNAERIVRVTRISTVDGAVTDHQANVAAAVGPTMQQTFAGIEAVTRVMFPYPAAVLARSEFTTAHDDGFLWTDPAFFRVFSYTFLRGDPATALAEPNTVVLTESAARKFFGDADPMGQTLTVDGWSEDDYRVTGVIEDVPATSHLPFTMLGSIQGPEANYTGLFEGEGAWTNSVLYTYLLLDTPATAARLEPQLAAFADQHLGAFGRSRGITYSFGLQPLTAAHLDASVETVVETPGDRRYVYLFTTVALLILLLACVNYVNLATARGGRRAREIGVRKAVGAARPQLVGQLLAESVVLAGLASALALGLVELTLPVLEALSGKALVFDVVRDGWAVLALGVTVGVLAGAYPAVVLSGARPVVVLKGQGGGRGHRSRLRQALIAGQFAVTVVLLASTFVIYQQLDHLQQRDLGFDRDLAVVVPIPTGELRRQAEPLKASFAVVPGVRTVSATSGVPGRLMLTDRWPVTAADRPDLTLSALAVMADTDLPATLGLELAAGRWLDPARPTDASSAFVINETTVRAFGWATPDDALGQTIHWQQGDGKTGTVVGVVRDFHMRSLHTEVQPTILHVFPSRYSALLVRVAPDDVPGTMAALGDAWQTLAPDRPFDPFFLDEQLASLYRAEARMAQTMTAFALLAVLIACLGLIGLATFTTAQRTKEIGVRKVMGATVPGVVGLLVRAFLRPVVVGFVLAVPAAWWLLHTWLDAFAYRISLGPNVFALAGAVAVAVALLSVIGQALRAATADPARALRYE